MSLYSGLSLRAIYERSCDAHECKKNATFAKTLPETPDLFTVPVTIDISNNFLGPRGLKPLFEVVRIASELRLLNLADQQMTNESVSGLCKAVRDHPSLVTLNLSKNPITVQGGMEIVDMLKVNKSIEVILLEQTEVRPTVLNLINAQLAKNTTAKRGGTIGVGGLLISASGSSVPADGSPASPVEGAAAAADAAASDTNLCDALYTQEIDEHAVRAAFAAIPATVSHKVLDEDPTAALKTLCSDFGKIFTDPQFPADMTSIQKTEANEYFVTHKKWRRISAMVAEAKAAAAAAAAAGGAPSPSSPSPTEFAASPTGDIFGPKVGEVLFPTVADLTIAADSVAATTPSASSSSTPSAPMRGFAWQWTSLLAGMGKGGMNMQSIRGLITPSTINPLGFYVVKLYINAAWRYIVVDDQLPVDVEGNLVFTPSLGKAGNTKSSATAYFWAAIYEKAMAKAYGSYQSLDVVVPQSVKHVLEKPTSPSALMKDAFGGVGIARDIHHQQFDSREWWQTMLSLPMENTAMIAVSSEVEARCEPAGVEASHCYVIQQIRQINGFSLIQLKSPYAARKYCDAWHDTCKSWSEYPLIADALGIAKKADSSFWVPYHRFLFLFKSVHLCRFFPHYNTRVLGSEWTALTGGGPYFGGRWGANPHFKFSVTERSNIFINLALWDARFKEAPESVETLGFHIIRRADYPIEFHSEEVVAKTEYVITNAVSYEGVLAAGDYWLVPSSYTPTTAPSGFWFRVMSTAPMVLSYEPEQRYWTNRAVLCDLASSGEYQNGEDNVQVELTIPATPQGIETLKVTVVVDVMEPSNDTNVVVFLVKPHPINLAEGANHYNSGSSQSNPRRFVGVIPDNNIVAKSPFVVGDRVCLETTMTVSDFYQFREQKYFIIPCVTPAKTKAKVNVSVYLNTPKFSVEQLPLWPRRSVKTEWRHSAPFLKLQTAAASLTHPSVNPQIELCPHDAEPHFIINMEVSDVVDPLIAFALVVNDDNVGKAIALKSAQELMEEAGGGGAAESPNSPASAASPNGSSSDFVSIPEGKILAKSRYIRHTSVSLEVKLPREVRAQSYVIVPYLQPAGSQGKCLITVSNASGGFAVRNLTSL